LKLSLKIKQNWTTINEKEKETEDKNASKEPIIIMKTEKRNTK
jgi:hypothetical protein